MAGKAAYRLLWLELRLRRLQLCPGRGDPGLAAAGAGKSGAVRRAATGRAGPGLADPLRPGCRNWLAPRSIYHLTGEARHQWEHSIAAMAATRWSITFRSLSDKGRSLQRA